MALGVNHQVQEEEHDRLTPPKLTHAGKIVDVQEDRGVKYAKGQSFQSLLEPALAPE